MIIEEEKKMEDDAQPSLGQSFEQIIEEQSEPKTDQIMYLVKHKTKYSRMNSMYTNKVQNTQFFPIATHE